MKWQGSRTRVTLHTAEPTRTQPSIAQHTTGQVADKMAVRERVNSAPKQADFVHLCVTKTIVVKTLFPVIMRQTLSKNKNCNGYSKVKNGMCKQAWLSKQIGALVCTASSVFNRSLFWAQLMLGCVLSARPAYRSGKVINQGYGVMQKNSNLFVFSDLIIL